MQLMDGLVIGSNTVTDGEGIVQLQKWMDETNRKLFVVGPLLPFIPGTTQFTEISLTVEKASAPLGIGPKVDQFLQNAVEKHGNRSVIYISFGSVFWSVNIFF